MLNQMTFDCSREVERKSFSQLLDFLIKYNAENGDHFNDIHIYQEEQSIIVEWVQVPYDGSYGGYMAYVDEDHTVNREVMMPDGSSKIAFTDRLDERFELFNEWKKEHPECKTKPEEYFNG